MQTYLISAAIGYLLGSIPFGYLLVRFFRGADVRTTGSGNIGATNVARTSPALGFVTLLLDLLKGFAAVWIATSTFPTNKTAAFAAAFAAVCGHVFPVWLRFRGGKGVATGLGSFLLLTPKAILLALAVFVVLVLAFRYISLGSIMAAVSLPALATILREASSPVQVGLISASSLLIIVKHHKNIQRLFSRSEPKFGSKRI
ncbi:MAG TPA: glycerol-3-phosphate 1-O-acyltransferase PlsY [Terriglobales bacterium]|nr:glycerol-3-phosphate 1-O-acyltransferase PlsY [Terriglobales bacterium]